jgi:hypothetical protein
MHPTLEKLRRRTLGLTESRRRQRYNCHQQDDESWAQRAHSAVRMWNQHGDTLLSPLRIADLGAGSERLRAVLEQDLKQAWEYFPFDLHPQKPTTRRLDIARELPPERYDVTVMLGVLEYLSDVQAVPPRLRGCSRFAVVSYVPTDWHTTITKEARDSIGWRSHLTRRDLEHAFADGGFRQVAATETEFDQVPLWLWELDGPQLSAGSDPPAPGR